MKPRPALQNMKTNRRGIDCHHQMGVPQVNPDPQYLSKAAGDQAEWASSEKRHFTIEFKSKSPFGGCLFQVPAGGGTVTSGRIEGPTGTYKYSLTNDQGKVTDPEIIVTP
jgi:hypothetical protein